MCGLIITHTHTHNIIVIPVGSRCVCDMQTVKRDGRRTCVWSDYVCELVEWKLPYLEGSFEWNSITVWILL